MIKLATITPINCITNEQDGEAFAVLWDENEREIIAQFESGAEESIDVRADSLLDAIDAVYALYCPSIAYIYEPESVEVDE